MVRVPDRSEPARTLRVVADLRLEVGDARGHTAGTLSSGPGGLVLEVDEPAVLLRSVPGRGLTRDLPLSMPPELVDGLSFRLRSRGRDLGRVRVTPAGKLRLWPTPAGLVVAGKTAASYGKGRAAVLAAAVAAGVLTAAGLRRRRRR